MTVAILIPHFGDPGLLLACLESIEKDYASTFCGLWDGNVENHGFAGNCNRIAAVYPEYDTFVFLNNDCVVHEGWLEPLLAALDDGHMIAGSRLLYPDGRVQHAGVTITDLAGHLVARNVTVDAPSRQVDAVTGASLAIRAEDFWALGGFDEGYWNGYEDVDLCLAARKAGGTIWYCADSVATHLESQSGPERWSKVRENEARLQEKWGNG